jgi:hypothetical protein
MSKDTDNLVGLGIKIGLGVAALIAILVLIGNMVTTVGADEIVIKQDVVGGHLTVWDTPRRSLAELRHHYPL